MKILEFQVIIRKITKILEFYWESWKSLNIRILLETYENHGNPWTSRERHENHENPKILRKNNENHENTKYLCDNYEKIIKNIFVQ